MKKKTQLILASFVLVFVGIAISACDGKDWYAEDTVLTDASHGGLTNHHVVATGKVNNITCNSATILFSANHNYKESLHIVTGILYSTSYDGIKYGDAGIKDVELNDFTNSACELTLTNLLPNTTYYYRAYAHADEDHKFEGSRSYMHYGEIWSFTTPIDNTPGEAVDLGLSVKWASHNIGTSVPEGTGGKFYWGGTVARVSDYKADWHDFTLSTLKNQGYIDDNNNLSPLYDAATKIWGSEWRMPTKDEFQELISKCSWNKTTKNGKDVYLITGPNSNIIYLPCCDHWTSTCNSSNAYLFGYYYYSYYRYRIADYSRSSVISIRPVFAQSATVVDMNTAKTPLNVAEAHAYITAGVGLGKNVYVKGIISKIDEISTEYGNATYYISDNGSEEGQLEVYRGYGLGGAMFSVGNEIKVGDVVIVYGNLINYNSTLHEFAQGSKIYSLNNKTAN